MLESLSDRIDSVRTLDRERLDHDRQSKLLKNEIDALSASLIADMKGLGVDNLHGARIVVKQRPYISDFTALEAYIIEHHATDLLQKRLTESAVKLRWEDGIAIPGVGLEEEEKLQIK